MMNSIEAYIQFTPDLVTPDGQVTNESMAQFLENYMHEFHSFIQCIYTVLPRRAS